MALLLHLFASFQIREFFDEEGNAQESVVISAGDGVRSHEDTGRLHVSRNNSKGKTVTLHGMKSLSIDWLFMFYFLFYFFNVPVFRGNKLRALQ
jgi:hypothetical protein